MKIIFLVLLFIGSVKIGNAQDANPNPNSFSGQVLDASYTLNDILLNKGDILSNALRIYNKSDQPVKFTIDMGMPNGFKFLSKAKVYEVPPKDSIFIPIRIMPRIEAKGNTQFLINSFILSEENKQLAHTYFTAHKQKISKWEVTVDPSDKIYFQNGMNSADFSVNLQNLGNEDQDLLMTINQGRKNYAITDTLGNNIDNPNYTLSLQPGQDSSFYFRMQTINEQRNFRRIDIDNYRPGTAQDERRYGMFVNSSDPKYSGRGSAGFGRKVNFVKLSNYKDLREFGNSSFPLIAEANMNNLMGSNPSLLLNFRGNVLLHNGANLVYNSQTNFVNNFYNNKLFASSAYYLGYFHEKGSFQVGNIGSDGLIGVRTYGRGVRGEYNIKTRHKVSAFFLKNPGIFRRAAVTSFGAGYQYSFSNGRKINVGYTHIDNQLRQTNSDLIHARSGFGITKNHNVNLIATGSRGTFPNTVTNTFDTKYGYFLRGNYQGTFMKTKLVNNFTGGYNSRYFAALNNERLYLNNRLRYGLSRKWTTTLINNYNTVTAPFSATTNLTNSFLYNQLNFSNIASIGLVQPFAFYNVSNFYGFRVHSRGAGLNYNFIDLPNNLRFASQIRAGYNNPIDFPSIKNYFIFQLNSFVYYHNISFRIRYNYGPTSVNDQSLLIQQGVNPQNIYMSLQHQHLFKNNRFVLQTATNYSYFNQFNIHTGGLFPEFYYYTPSGWRFRVIASMSVAYSNINKAGIYNTLNNLRNAEENKPSKASIGFNLGAGVRKEFSIRNPFSEEKPRNIQFVAFYDLDGNGFKDPKEVSIENVVIKINDWEVLTDEEGKAKLTNIPMGKYQALILPLEDQQGWFPAVADTLNIDKDRTQFVPFVRGVKIYGNVVLDREKMTADSDKPFDLSRIRITATNGKAYYTLTDFNGGFEFYLPYGEYTFTMDENVLGDQFILLQNNMTVALTKKIDNMNVSFYVIERQRRINKKKF